MESMVDSTKEAVKKPEIQFWLAIFIPLIGIAVQWGVLTSQISEIKNNHARLETEVGTNLNTASQNAKELDIRLLNMEIKLAEIQKDITFLRDRAEK